MALGFREAFKAGISFGKDDMVVPENEAGASLRRRARSRRNMRQQYNDGLIPMARIQQGGRRLGEMLRQNSPRR